MRQTTDAYPIQIQMQYRCGTHHVLCIQLVEIVSFLLLFPPHQRYGVASISFLSSDTQSSLTTIPATDFPGNDIGIPIISATLQSCEQACIQSPNCVAFIFGTRPGFPAACQNQACCYLKSSIGPSPPVRSETLKSYLSSAGVAVGSSVTSHT